MTYPGAKGGAGVYQTIINQIPPHEIYIEPFAGSAAVMRHLRPARSRIAIDRDAAARDFLPADVVFVQGCGLQWLGRRKWTGREFVYCDPPYIISSRRSPRPLYRYELTDLEHRILLDVLAGLPCPVALSGYRTFVYEEFLEQRHGWRWIEYTNMTRGGPVTERLWMNYPEPAALHDYRYLGETFRDRERIKRKAARWVRNLVAMPPLERQAVMSALAQAPATTAETGDAGSRAASGDAPGRIDENNDGDVAIAGRGDA